MNTPITDVQPSTKAATRRTIKISDELHHKLRVRSVTDRVKMQDLIERLLDSALKA